MRHRERQQTAGMFRGAELTRLLTGVVMLGVIVMLIVRARDASNWRWLVHDNKAAAADKAQPKQAPKPLAAATGPTDEDADEAEEARNEFQVLTDGTLNLGPEEQDPYDRVVQWVNNQPFERIYDRAKKSLRYSDLYDDAERRRGQLAALNLTVVDVNKLAKNRDGVALQEAWATTDEARGRLYDLIVVDYPEKMPTGYNIREKARFAGYFLKLQGYEPGSAKPGQPPEKAPLLIGRLEWEPTVVPQTDDTWEWTLGLSVLAIIAVVWGVGFLFNKSMNRTRGGHPALPDVASGDVIPIEQWLERPGFGDDDRAER